MVWTLIELTAADQIFVYRKDQESQTFIPIIALGALDLREKQGFWENALDPATDVLLAEVAKTLHPVEIARAEDRRRFAASLLSFLRTRSFLVLPLTNHGQLFGIVVAAWLEEGRRLEGQQLALTRTLTRAMALVFENAYLYEVTHQQLHQALTLQEITRAILQKVSLQDVLARIAQEAMGLTDALGCGIRLMDEDTRQWETAFSSGSFPNDLQEILNAEQTMRGEPVLAQLPAVDELPQSAEAPTRHAALIVPLRMGEETIGFLELILQRAFFQPHHAAMTVAFASHAVIAIEHARLYSRLQRSAVVEERARLARDLHDSISQSLYALTLFARAAQRQYDAGNSDAVQRYLAELRSASHSALGEMRLLIYELRPPVLEKLGLQGALEQRLKSVEERSGLSVQVSFDLPARLPLVLEENLYRIAQEALNNSTKHASAAQVWLELSLREGILRLLVRDDGNGFDPARLSEGGLGITGMRERAQQLGGTLTIRPGETSGTVVEVEVPYDADSYSDR